VLGGGRGKASNPISLVAQHELLLVGKKKVKYAGLNGEGRKNRSERTRRRSAEKNLSKSRREVSKEPFRYDGRGELYSIKRHVESVADKGNLPAPPMSKGKEVMTWNVLSCRLAVGRWGKRMSRSGGKGVEKGNGLARGKVREIA